MGHLRVAEVDDDGLDEYFAVRAQSFGVGASDLDAWRAFLSASPEALRIGAYDERRLLGALRVLPTGQYLLGRSVRTGAVAGVVVRPEARGRGVAARLLEAALDWMRSERIVASALHPASTRVYRSRGWEIAGLAGHVSVPSRSLAVLRAETAAVVERLDATDFAARQHCYDAVARTVHGAFDRSPTFWRMHAAADVEDGAFVYGVRDGTELRGYVAYTQLPRASWGYQLRVDDVWARDRDAAIAIWQFLGAHSMQVEHIEVPIPAVATLLLLLDEQDVTPLRENRWMHRVVDVPGFLSARGFPSGLEAAVTVGVTDRWVGGVSGMWRLEAADGHGTATAVRPDAGGTAVRTDVGALSALLVGGFTVAELVAAGRMAGDPEDLERLGALAAAPPPWITDDF